jgi:putative peptide zinc metalloprotease protein
MSGTAGVLSEAWFQVADARVALLSSVRAQPQTLRGRRWMVLEDPYSNRFFRVTPEAWAFLRALRADRSVGDTWAALAAAQPDAVPGQDDVVRLLSQLHVASLLHYEEAPRHEAIFERAEATRKRELTGKWLAFLYVRVPLFSPDRWLDSIQPLIRATTGRMAGLVWLLVVVAGIAAVVQRPEALSASGQGLLSVANLPWLYIALALVKVLHELAHAFVCKRYGGSVPSAGVMFLIFTPLPYVDASASWGLRRKWQRAYVGAAGMLMELFLAAIGALVWASTGEGLVNSLAFNVMVVGSVSSLLFNGNPLLRFDAYYILSDLAELPNLYQKAQAQWLYWGSRFLLGQREGVEPATDSTERRWYTVYGFLAFFYRLLITFTVLLFVLDQWFAVGVLMAITTLVMLVLMPLAKLRTHLGSAVFERRRPRALAGMAVVVALAWALVALVPVPHALRLPGVLQAERSQSYYALAPGVLVELAVRHGQPLQQGDLIARLANPELDQALRATESQIAETAALERAALARSPAELAPLASRSAALRERLAELQGISAQLELRARHAGEWVAPTLHERQGGWIDRGQPIGQLVDRARWRFSAVLPQSQAAELLGQAGAVQGSELRLAARRGESLAISRLVVVPYQRQQLASAALGYGGGGEVATQPEDTSGLTTSEPFFEIRAELSDPALDAALAYQGLSGVLRVPVAARPLADRLGDAWRQLLQQRYRL